MNEKRDVHGKGEEREEGSWGRGKKGKIDDNRNERNR